MSTAGGSNEKPILYDDLSEVVKRGDLIRSANVEDRVYLVLDIIYNDHSSPYPYAVGLKVLTPESKALSGLKALYSDVMRHSSDHIYFFDFKFSITQREQ